MPKVSVIIPVYKVEKYLERCVASIQKQTLRDMEIILVDDGSPDNCPALCDQLAQTDDRIQVIHKENGGVAAARNSGLDAAQGEYIAFVDSDDYIEPDMYERMVNTAEMQDCDVVLCDCIKEFGEHTELYTHNIRKGKYSREQLENEYFPHLLMLENVEYPATISNCILLFRRELTASVRYLDGVRYSEDLLFGAQLLYRAKSFYYLKGQAYYHYYMNDQSATHKFVPDKWNDYLRLHRGIQQEFGNCADYNFVPQIDLCMLFFLYNTVGDIMRTEQLNAAEKKRRILKILRESAVTEMFERLNIRSLQVSSKQKIITWLYKKRLAIGLLVRYYGRK